MSSKRAWIAVAVVVAALAAFAFGGASWMWDKLLEMHGLGPRHAAHPLPAAPKATPDPWPETAAGARARGWVEAFGAGEEAMRAFTAAAITEAGLKEKPLEDRMATYRESRRRFGTLKLDTVLSSEPYRTEVVLFASDGAPYDFTFEVESAEPHRLVAVKRIETRSVPR